jgi:hypothetical protein
MEQDDKDRKGTEGGMGTGGDRGMDTDNPDTM